jgi:hypothetical protein
MSTTIRLVPHTVNTEFGVEEVYSIDGLNEAQATPTPPSPTPTPSQQPNGKAKPYRDFAYIMADRPPPVFLVENIIMEGRVNLFFGGSGYGKSYALFTMLACIATGEPWLGRKVKQQKCLLLDEDNGDSRCSDRFAEIYRGLGITEEVPLGYISMSHFKLDVPADLKEIKKIISDIGAKVILFDSVARFMTGDENSAQDMQKVAGALREIAEDLKVTIIAIHHTGKDEKKGERGSSLLRDSVDLSIQIIKNKEDSLTFSSTKTRDISSAKFSAQPEWDICLDENGIWNNKYSFKILPVINKAEFGAGVTAVLTFFKTHNIGTCQQIENSASVCKPRTAKNALYTLIANGVIYRASNITPYEYAVKEDSEIWKAFIV